MHGYWLQKYSQQHEPHLFCAVYFDRAASAGGVVAVRPMTPEEQNEMIKNLQAMSEMLTLLDRLIALDDVLVAEPIQHTRWAMAKLAKRNWRLTF